MDAVASGFEAVVVADAVRGIDHGGSVARAWDHMIQAGVGRTMSAALLDRAAV